MNHLSVSAEQHGGNIGSAFGLLLLFDHGIEAADGVALQTSHGTAAVDNENQFSQTLTHDEILLCPRFPRG